MDKEITYERLLQCCKLWDKVVQIAFPVPSQIGAGWTSRKLTWFLPAIWKSLQEDYPDIENIWNEHIADVLAKVEEEEIEYLKRMGESCRRYKEEKEARKDYPGFVYVLKAENGLYKIGRAKEVNSRIETIDGILPFDTELIHTIQSNKCRRAEKHFHTLFEEKNVKGEWYDLTENDIEYLKEIEEHECI